MLKLTTDNQKHRKRYRQTERTKSIHLNTCLCNTFYDLSTLVGCWSSVYIRRIIYTFLNVCPVDYTAFAVSGKVGYPLTGLITPVGLLLLLQLTVLSRSAIVG